MNTILYFFSSIIHILLLAEKRQTFYYELKHFLIWKKKILRCFMPFK